MSWAAHNPEGWDEVERLAVASWLRIDEESMWILEVIQDECPRAWDHLRDAATDKFPDAEADYLMRGAP